MSDDQFNNLCQYLWDGVVATDRRFSETMASMELGHWILVFIALIMFGAMMMRGLGMKKFG
ncbi:MAG: hypothetical protein R3B96_09840 [Pirellulaceae bacterium]|nr:hypothetical protein [Planctomycetales bacterium]